MLHGRDPWPSFERKSAFLRMRSEKVSWTGLEARAKLRQEAYSALMLAALIMGHHFSMSAFCKAPSRAGVC
jgi:hypothetical protein